jgi:hypothetical protein
MTMTTTLDRALGSFREQDYSVQVCRTLFSAVPGAPPFAFYADTAGAASRLAVPGNGDLSGRIVTLAGDKSVERALWVADALDKADMGLAAYSGVTSLLRLFGGGAGPKRRVFESDTQQAIDAVLKALGLSYMASLLMPGSPAEKAMRFAALPAGRDALIYYAVAEVALPFADNLAEGGAAAFSKLMRMVAGDGTSKFRQVMGADAAAGAAGMLEQLRRPIEEQLDQARRVVGPLTEKLKAFMPAALGFTGSVTGAMATGLDAMPIWRFLGARLAAEATVMRADEALRVGTA